MNNPESLIMVTIYKNFEEVYQRLGSYHQQQNVLPFQWRFLDTNYRMIMDGIQRNVKEMKDGQKKKILDVAGGDGTLAMMFTAAGYDVTVLDNSQTAINLSKEIAPNVRYVDGDMKEEFPFDDGEFDGVTCSMSIFYAQDSIPGAVKEVDKRMKTENLDSIFYNLKSMTLKEIRRVLKDGGPFVTSSVNPTTSFYQDKIRRWIDDGTLVIPMYSPAEFINMLGDVGFNIKSIHGTHIPKQIPDDMDEDEKLRWFEGSRSIGYNDPFNSDHYILSAIKS